MRKVALFITTDGRLECLEKTMASLSEKVNYPFAQKFIICDSLDSGFRSEVAKLAAKYDFYVMHFMIKAGFAGVYRVAWQEIEEDITHVFNSEDDFTYNVPVDIEEMGKVLDDNPHLVQLCLKRQPWNEQEKKAGGIIECWPQLYKEFKLIYQGDDGTDKKVYWCEHNLFYSTNPSLTPISVIRRGWPYVERSEEAFSRALFASDSELRSAYLGKRFDTPTVYHIGMERVGTGY